MMRIPIIFAFAVFISQAGNAQTLAEAINLKDTVTVARLILAGEDINKADEYGTTFLMNACRYGKDTIGDFLLRHGAKPDEPKSPKGRTSLIVACAYYGDIPICRLLLKYGANINVAANDGTTALMMAAQNEKSNLVAFLIAMGANAAAKDIKGNTALDYAKNATVTEWMQKSMPDAKIDKEETIKILTAAFNKKP